MGWGVMFALELIVGDVGFGDVNGGGRGGSREIVRS